MGSEAKLPRFKSQPWTGEDVKPFHPTISLFVKMEIVVFTT